MCAAGVRKAFFAGRFVGRDLDRIIEKGDYWGRGGGDDTDDDDDDCAGEEGRGEKSRKKTRSRSIAHISSVATTTCLSGGGREQLALR